MDPKSSLGNALARERAIAPLHKLQKLFESFSISEKAVFLAAALVFAVGAFILLKGVSDEFMVEIPSHGGSLSEGVIGTPRFINPLLAVSDADKDLVSLVYSGLLKATPDGRYVPDLASSFSVSPDGLTYSFIIRDDATFQDGTPVTADDVEFTVQKAQDNALKSPKRISWEGVAVTKQSAHEISFSLKQPYAPFISNLTLGILPKHIWKSFESDQFPFSSFNVEPVGSGPYRIASVSRNGQGIPSSVSLTANARYAGGEPYISKLSFSFFSNDKALAGALRAGEVESASNLSPSTAHELASEEGDARVLKAPLTRVFGVFFNQNSKEIFAHKEVRKALDASVDKDEIISGVLYGYAAPADGPLPLSLSERLTAVAPMAAASSSSQILSKAGWKRNPSTDVFELKGKSGTSTLAFSLATANIPDLVEAARRLEEGWDTMGAQVDVNIYEPSDLNQSVITPRKYDALLFGMVVGRTPDLYPFWHSSQRNSPGLNISLYTNAKADSLLQSMRQASDPKAFKDLYSKLKAEIVADTGAIFLWSPDFAYAVPDKLHGISLGWINSTSDRFLGIEKWYVEKERVWKIFAKSEEDIITESIN